MKVITAEVVGNQYLYNQIGIVVGSQKSFRKKKKTPTLED